MTPEHLAAIRYRAEHHWPASAADVPVLLAEVERLAAELAQARSAIQHADATTGRRTAERDQARAECREWRAEAEKMRLVLAMHGQGVDPEGVYAGTPGFRLRQLNTVISRAQAWREEQSASTYLGTPSVDLDLIAAVDALESEPCPDHGKAEVG